MSIFEQITLKEATPRIKKTAIYKILHESNVAVVAQEVDNEGDDLSYYNKSKIVKETLHVIDKDLIKERTPMTIDKKYGVLVKKGEETQE